MHVHMGHVILAQIHTHTVSDNFNRHTINICNSVKLHCYVYTYVCTYIRTTVDQWELLLLASLPADEDVPRQSVPNRKTQNHLCRSSLTAPTDQLRKCTHASLLSTYRTGGTSGSPYDQVTSVTSLASLCSAPGVQSAAIGWLSNIWTMSLLLLPYLQVVVFPAKLVTYVCSILIKPKRQQLYHQSLSLPCSNTEQLYTHQRPTVAEAYIRQLSMRIIG